MEVVLLKGTEDALQLGPPHEALHGLTSEGDALALQVVGEVGVCVIAGYLPVGDEFSLDID